MKKQPLIGLIIFICILGTALAFNATSSSYKLKTVQTGGSVNTTTVTKTYDFISDLLYGIQNNRTSGYYLRLGFLEVKVANIELRRNGTFFMNTTTTTRFEFNNHSFNSFNATKIGFGGDIDIDAIVLNSSSSGLYTSQVLNPNAPGATPIWRNITWMSVPYGELPPYEEQEIRFVKGNVNMSGNSWLFHFNNETEENNTFFRDWSGTGNNGTCNLNTVSCPFLNQSGKLRHAVQFDGVNDTISGNLTVNMRTPNITVMAWVFPLTVLIGQTVVALEPVGAEIYGRGVWLRINPSGNAQWRKGKDGYEFNTVQSGAALSSNVWTHLAGTYDGTTMRLYINGFEDSNNFSNSAISWATSGGDTPNPPQAYVGGYRSNSTVQPNTAPDTDFFSGLIEEVVVMNRSLSAAEINNLFQRSMIRMNLSVRSCDDPYCGEESFVDANDTPLQNLSINRNVDERWLQYQMNLSTDNQSISPELYNVTVGYDLENHIYLNLTDNTVNLGDLELGRTEDSEGKNDFFNVTNEGTTPITMFAYASGSPFSTVTDGANVLPNNFFQIHANSSASGTANTTYGAIPATFANRVRLVSSLDHTRGVDHALVGIRVTVPSDERQGTKSANVILIAEQS